MRDTKLIQAILDNQVAMRNELNQKIDKVQEQVTKNGTRIDSIGKQLAYLEDDTPTRKEFDKLERKFKKFIQNTTL